MIKKVTQVGFFLSFLLLFIYTNAFPAEVTLAWDPSPDNPDGYNIHYGRSSGNYSQTIDVGNATDYTVSGLLSGVTYFFVTRAYNQFGESGNSNEVSWIYAVVDTQPPMVTINGPSTTKSSSVNLSGTANDNVGVTEVTWDCDTGGNGTAVGTTNWVINSISLSEGQNIITVSAADAAGNIGTAEITITYTPAPIKLPLPPPTGLHIIN